MKIRGAQKLVQNRIPGVARLVGLAFALSFAAADAANAQNEAPAFDSGDTAWMLTSTALVLMMTVPGLALFYGGMVRKKNVLATAMQSFAVTCLMTIIWMVAGYSLAFKNGGPANAVIGAFAEAV